jgi:hypothetical protein
VSSTDRRTSSSNETSSNELGSNELGSNDMPVTPQAHTRTGGS